MENIKQQELPQFLSTLAELGVSFDQAPTVVVGDSAIDTQTVGNAGIPAAAASIINPQVIRQVFAPMQSQKIFPEQIKGSFAHENLIFPRTEETYEVVSYGDYNNTGGVNTNANFETRKNYAFQTIAKWGEREQAKLGLALIPYIQMQQTGAIRAISRLHNKINFYGVEGGATYGIINDPALNPAITPTTDSASKIKWSEKANGQDIYNDVVKMVSQLYSQTAGLVDDNANFLLSVSPANYGLLKKLNSLGNRSVYEMLQASYPNMTLLSVPEFATVSGGWVMLSVSEIEGQPVGMCAPSAKLKSFAVEPKGSYAQQKVAGSTFGAVITMPVGVVTMTGTD